MAARVVRISMAAGAVLWLAAYAAPPAWAQASPFQIRVQQGNATFLVGSGSTLNFPASAAGKSASLTMTLVYQGSTSATVSQPQIFGSNFTVSSQTPATVGPGGSVAITLTYTAPDSNQAVAQLNIPYVEAGASPQLPGTSGILSFVLAGTAPQMVVTYALPNDGNVFTVDTGSTITFPATVVGTTLTAGVAIVNRGSGSGKVQNIVVSGDGFTPQQLPLLPFSLAAGSNLQFGVRYAPTQAGNNTGTLEVDFSDRTVTISLTGTAIGSLLSYQLQQANQTTPVSPNQTLNFPDTNVGEKSSLTLVVKNVSVSTVTVASILATGTGFTVTDAPITPFNMNPNDTFVFTVTFAPAQPGPATGRLRVANDTFNLMANAIGPQLSFSYSTGSGSTPVNPGGTILFSPEPLGQSEQVALTIQNTGTTTASITSIGVTDPKAPFTVASPPTLPLTLNPNQSVTVNLVFTAATTGLASATLLVDAQQFTLAGLGNSAPPLPGYQFTGASGNEPPLSQVAVGLTLSAAYPVQINGTLTIAANSGSLPSDPAVQFATGNRSATFTIPANSTQAVFTGGANQIGLQTGSVAETITITPDFVLTTGQDITPSSPPTVSFTVPAGPPHLQNAFVTQNSQNTLVLQINGYATTRSISALAFQFTASSSANLPNGNVTLNIQPEGDAWFASSGSQSFGGQFSVQVPFTIGSTGTTTTPTTGSTVSLNTLLQAVSITASNGQGTSNVVSVPISQ